ncbi:hypothetical protein [Brevundimonas sp. Root1423]|uniref:hypothetical protein n=1 Tax=Brevundimonas sp. Root1423 TaxID=1736462 RepID=UPI0006F228B2|nr:hypothetical protein [Brevundimonas sp. Root1423]KQY89884.1 hypothetical protein ASD25_05005 [Brevundimonas sp. Root1423]
MKTLLIAAAFLLAPAAAQAQVAAATVPNSFDRPASQAPRAATPAPAAPAAAAVPAMSTTPANARSEELLREIIAGGQAGALPYALMTDDLAGKVRAQEAGILPLLQGFGAIQALDFVGSRDGADLFAVTFATAATQWIVGIDESGKVAALLFRPAE